MFGNLSDKFNDAFRKLSGQGKISESNVREAMEEVRTALLEADVHYDVAQEFCDSVVEKAVGTEVLEAVSPGQQMIKVVYDELVALMGPVGHELLEVDPGPTIIMMCGLQGSGKTTTCGKLTALLKKKGKNVMLCAADLQRPAAVQQLETLSKQVQDTAPGSGEVHFYAEMDKVAEYGKAVGAAVTVCRNAVKAARTNKCDVLILDTAGRLHVNDELMDELRRVTTAVTPHHIFLVIDAMTGQDAVNSAKAFNDELEIDGVVLTKFDSDTRGGAALSVKHITGKPIRYIGMGEHLDALEEFHPERVSSRLLGMGDVVTLVEKAQEQVSEEEAQALQDKLAAGKMTMDDFLKQLKAMRRMGSMKSLIGLLPGIGQQFKDINIDEREIDRTEAIIESMTKAERANDEELNNSRRRRVAAGSGTYPQEVSQLVKSFEMISKLGQDMSDLSGISKLKTMASMNQEHMAAMAQGRQLRIRTAEKKEKPKRISKTRGRKRKRR